MRLPVQSWAFAAFILLGGAFALGCQQGGWGRALEASLRAFLVVSLLAGVVQSYRATRQRRP